MDIKRIGEAGQLRSMDTVNGFDVRPGFYLQNGATAIEGGVSFTVHTKNGTACTLVLYERKHRNLSLKYHFRKITGSEMYTR